ncbi:MAG: hypothetical protein WAZ18_00745 [Alphaproteobacteria bacterium]
MGISNTLQRWWGPIGTAVHAHFFTRRQQVVNIILSMLYGTPMQVVPKGYVGLAGAVVLWYIEGGIRYLLMARQEPKVLGGDGKARFISCLGLGSSGDMGAALRRVATAQLGEVFVRSVLGKGALQADKVACAPVFNYTDEHVGVPTPVQSLVWVVQINPHMLDVVISPSGVQALRVPENALASDKISPTHKSLFATVQAHLPKMRPMPAPSGDMVEETIRELSAGARIVH